MHMQSGNFRTCTQYAQEETVQWEAKEETATGSEEEEEGSKHRLGIVL